MQDDWTVEISFLYGLYYRPGCSVISKAKRPALLGAPRCPAPPPWNAHLCYSRARSPSDATRTACEREKTISTRVLEPSSSSRSRCTLLSLSAPRVENNGTARSLVSAILVIPGSFYSIADQPSLSMTYDLVTACRWVGGTAGLIHRSGYHA